MSSKKVSIIGAGITGLAAAWHLKKREPKTRITIYEKTDRAGGWIKTIRKDGFLFELGPRSLRPHPVTLQLIEELGLKDDIIEPVNHTRYIYNQGKIEPVKLLSPVFKGLYWTLLKGMFKKVDTTHDLSVYDYFSQRFSSEFAERLVDPLTLGIYAGDMRQLSMKACFPAFLKGGFKRGPSLYTLRDGMESLVHALVKALDAEIVYNCSAPDFEADEVISTIPAYALAEYCKVPKIPFKSLKVINVGYREDVLPYKGFGYLVPTREKQPIYGVVFDSSVFPQQNASSEETRLTLMMPEESDPLEILRTHLKIKTSPDVMHSYIAKNAIAQYPVGFKHNREQYPFKVIGSSFTGVAVNDCIRSSLDDLM